MPYYPSSSGGLPSRVVRITGSEPLVRSPTGTNAKLAINTVVLNAEGWWNTSSKRFIPQLAGRYLLTAYCSGGAVGGAGDTINDLAFCKNGVTSPLACVRRVPAALSTYGPELAITYQVIMNGSSDYIELWGSIGHATLTTTLACTQQLDIVYLGPA